MKIICNLRLCMAKAGIKTKQELSKKANVSMPFLKKLDNSDQLDNAYLGKLIDICIALNCSLDELISFEKDE